MSNRSVTLSLYVRFVLHIIDFYPDAEIGAGWDFVPDETHGPNENDGVQDVVDIISMASEDYDDGSKLLFATGLEEGQHSNDGEQRLVALAEYNLADPELLWSLLKQQGQRILRYLYGAYDVAHLESLRRVIKGPDGRRYGFRISRDDTNGIWEWSCLHLSAKRDADEKVLILGSPALLDD